MDRCRRCRGSRARPRCSANVTGTPASCICATSPSVFFANIPSKPGKPHWPNGSAIGLPVGVVDARRLPWLIAGLTYFAPKSALKPGVAARLVRQRVGPRVRRVRRCRCRRRRRSGSRCRRSRSARSRARRCRPARSASRGPRSTRASPRRRPSSCRRSGRSRVRP